MLADASAVSTVAELAALLRRLRRRQARLTGAAPATYRTLAEQTGWARSAIGQYLNGQTLPPTDRFAALVDLFGAGPAEHEALADARDRLAEAQRRRAPTAAARPAPPAAGPQPPPAGHHNGPVPRQLPAPVAAIAGRADAVAALDDLLAGGPHGRPVRVVAVSGPAGVGKTTLAIHWAHRVADRFPDGQLFINLKGFDPVGPPVTPAAAARGFLNALGTPPDRIPMDPDAQLGLYRTELAQRRILIVLDNASSVEQIRPLLPGAAGCLVLVTCRYQPTALVATDAAHPLRLDLLTSTGATELLTERLGADRLAAEPAATRALISTCARLPLALAIVAARAATHPTFTLADLNAELAAGNTLDRFNGGDPTTDLRTVLSWSYRRLRPAAARLFRLLALHPGPDLSAAAAASLAGCDARALLSELTYANLLTEHSPDRYLFHDLLRSYATELVETLDAEQRTSAQLRLLDHYLHTAHAAARHIAAHRDDVSPGPAQPGVTPEPVTGHRQATAWFRAERPVLLAAIRQAAALGLHNHTWQLAWTLIVFLHIRGHWHDALATQTIALAAVRRTGDTAAQAAVYRDLAHAYARLDQFADANRYLHHATVLHARTADHNGLAWTEHRLAWTADQQGRGTAAISHSHRALQLFEQTGNQRGLAHVHNNTGWYYALLGDQRKALIHCRRAHALYQQLGNRIGQANSLDSIGYAHLRNGEHERAAHYYTRALHLFRALGEPYYEAQALTHLGDAQHAAGDGNTARTAWQAALAIFDTLDHPNADDLRAKLALPSGLRSPPAR
ncbi:ATP-binding protein [Virgisporangium aurantiacum]|uniref:HTH cro/C1-type domain-containing protein n=1 Tax=Virgisporangium aurantiacum TaxID=175570 RepID=A0A8J3ZFA4_9ACTN|nr:tetratricopeptide repeat protein [Virgisporangium aurantiacum]GIJ61837.1 hypothetical protein Vau01_093530 [Virgisporangium aurantiacum]